MLDQNISCSSVHSLLIISSYLNENGNPYFLSDSSMGNRIVIIILMKLLTNIVCLRQTWWKWPFDKEFGIAYIYVTSYEQLLETDLSWNTHHPSDLIKIWNLVFICMGTISNISLHYNVNNIWSFTGILIMVKYFLLPFSYKDLF